MTTGAKPHERKMVDLQRLRDDNGGRLPSFAWPGGYAMIYWCRLGQDQWEFSLCGDCAEEQLAEVTIVDIETGDRYEDDMTCENCGRQLAAYYEAPDPDDLVLSSTGPLGSRTLLSVVDGPVLGEYSTEEEALQAARDYCQREKYWPDLWRLSDHGNWHRIQNIREG